jgi:hypothetical protein
MDVNAKFHAPSVLPREGEEPVLFRIGLEVVARRKILLFPNSGSTVESHCIK